MKKVVSLIIAATTVCGLSYSCGSGASGRIGDHDFVDLGLSVLWATTNVGADSPSDAGDHFAWAETTPKDIYDTDNCRYIKSKTGSLDVYEKYMENGLTFRGDGKTILDLEDDAARQNWGENWRMPTAAEIHELLDNCTWELQENKGYKVTGPNGNSIFLPFTGKRVHDRLEEKDAANYWTSERGDPSYSQAIALLIWNGGRKSVLNHRYVGYSVRPVAERGGADADVSNNSIDADYYREMAIGHQETFYKAVVNNDMELYDGVDYEVCEIELPDEGSDYYEEAYSQWKKDNPDKWRVIKEFRQRKIAEGYLFRYPDLSDE